MCRKFEIDWHRTVLRAHCIFMVLNNDETPSLCNFVAKTPGGHMPPSPSLSSNHDLLSVLHEWPHVSRQVAGHCVIKIMTLESRIVKNIKDEGKKQIATVLYFNFARRSAMTMFDCKNWNPTAVRVSTPLLCLQIWHLRAALANVKKQIDDRAYNMASKSVLQLICQTGYWND